MATSGSTNFATSRDQLISGALRMAGAIAQGETPSATLVSEASEALNMFVKAKQADGMPLWAIKKYSVTLTATGDYTIGVGSTVNTPKPLKVIQAYLSYTASGTDVPVRIITRQEYEMLGNKTSVGYPNQVFYEPLNTTGVLHVYPVPDATVAAACTLKIIYQRPFEDFDASTDEPDFPQEYYHAIKLNLADILAPEHGLAIQDRQDLSRRALAAWQEALGFGTEEGSMYIMADVRG
jgi:hypothetical protein